MTEKKVVILMATYNGAQYLPVQLDSILNQDFEDWQLLISDDGSTDGTLNILDDCSKDNTVKIIQEYEKKDDRIKVIDNEGKNLGAIGNFFELIKKAPDASYYAFSDQDDYWHEDKIEKAVERLEQMSSKNGENIPIAYCGAKEITNEKLSELESAYYQHMSLLQSEELNIEYVSLCNHVQCEENRISTSENKINMYMTIILTVIPLLVAIVDINQVKELSILAKLSIAIVIYTILNIGFYLFRIMKVKKFKLSKFGELKESSDKVKMQNWQMYNDWQNLKSKADLYVSYVLNVEEWIKFLAIIGVLLACIFSINPNWICTQKNMQVQQTKSYVCVVQVDEISDVYSESSRNWNAVLMDLSQNKFSNVIVLYKDDVDIDEIQIVLSEYSKQKIDYIKDKSLTSKSVKLIMED